jgi:ubiquinone/menaquinone biosynthesis C-methylase UbiE
MRRNLFLPACALLIALGIAWIARADAASEMSRLAALMGWHPGTILADIGAGDGRFSFEAAAKIGDTGKVYATELDPKKIEDLQAEIKKRGLKNIEVVKSAEAVTNLPPACCDAIFLRRVYHHLTKPEAFDRDIVQALKPGGRLAIIDFPARAGLESVEGVPANRGGHGIPEKIVIQELTAAGLQLEKTDDHWPESSYSL